MNIKYEATEFNCPVCGGKGMHRVIHELKPNPFLDKKPYVRSLLYTCGAGNCGAEFMVVEHKPDIKDNRIHETLALIGNDAGVNKGPAGSGKPGMEYFELPTGFKVNEGKA